jgi:ankyrin repeat protein
MLFVEESMTRCMWQAEIKDRTLSKQIKGEAKTKTEKASEARRQSNFELAVVLSEEALEMCHRCEDQDLLAAAETVKQSAVNMAKETYTAAVEKLKAILADARMDIDKQSFEEAKTGINSGFEILRADNLLLASIRALQHVDPFQEYPTMEDELTALNDEAVTKERTFKAHKEFGLKQGLVQMRRFENIVSVSMHTLQRHTNKRVVKGLHAEVLDVLRLVQHDDGTFGRVEDLKSKVESILKTQSNTDQGVLKQAAQLQHQAETQLKYAKFLEAKRLTMASQWHLIQAEAQENEFAKGENMLATVKTDAIQALKAKSKEFIRLSEKALDAFEQSTGFDTANLQKAIEVAKDCRNCLGQIVNDQLLCAVFYPGTNNHVKWLSWGESTAQEISKFCEFLQALAFVRVVSPPRLTSFDILTAYECPTHMYPIVPVAQCYGDGELMRELPKDGANLQSRTGEDRMGTLISSSEALDILEGKLESPTIKTIEVFEIDWSLIAKTVQERLKSELGKIAELKEREEEEEEEEEEEKDFLLKAMAEDAHGQIEKYQDDEFYRESDNAHDESLECSQDAGIAETASPGNASTLQASVEESNTVGCTPVCSQPSTAPEAPVATSKKPPSPAGETNSDEKIGESPSPSASSSLAPAVDASPTAKTIDMVDALERGDFEAARALVDNGADVNATQSNGENVLLKFLEAKDCSIETMRFLLEHGANVRDVNVESRQVLHLAAMHDRGDIVEEIAASAESSCQNRDAVSVKGLLQVMLDAKDKHGKTPIDLALDSRCTNALGNLVSLGANTLALGSDGLNCIHRAIKQDHREAIPILLDSTKNLESKTATGMTSLMLACEKGNLQLVELLCSRGSKVNAKDEDGRTPLHISAHAGNPEVMRTLLDRGAECESSDVFGCSPAYYCIVQGHTSCLHLLIENSSPLNQTVNGHSLLYIASYLGRIDMVKLMVDSGCPLFAGCTSGFAPLHAATCMGHNRIIETLSKAHAADADSQSEYAQVHRIAQCLAVIKANTTALRTLQDHLPKQDPFSTLRHVVTWDAGKLSALLGRVDLFQLLQGDASAANSRPTTAGTSGAASARLSTSHSADIQTRPSTAETVGLSLHLSTSHGADFQSEVGGSCSKELFPVPHYREDADTDNIVSNILRMLMSDESSVLDIVSMCLEEQVEIVADGAVGSRPQSGISRVGSIEYNTLMKNLVGNKSKSENRDRMLNDVNATDVAHCQIEERMIYACYPMPSLPNPEIRQPLPNYGSTQLDLPDEVESRLLAQDNQLRKMISDAQDHALEQCRVTAATMRLLLKRAKLASIAGSAEEAMGCLSESSSFYGHCSVCLHLKNLEANSSRICKVCELRKQLYDDTRQTILNKLFSFNMECAEKHILLKQAANADRALKLARKWLDDILGDKTPTSAEDKEKQSRLVKLEDHYIHSQVIEQVEDLLRNVCAQDASRRSKMAIKRYSEDLTRLIANVFDLLKAFANNQCNPADISGRIEDLNGIRASFVRCGDLVSMDDYVGLERIQLVIAGINNISQAWTRVKDGLSKAESRDGFSLLLAHKCALECQSLCAASRSDLNRLKFQLTEQAKEPAHDSDGLVLHKSLQLSDTVLMQESKNLGARYLSVAAKVLDQLDEQFEFLFKRVNEQQTSFLEHKMEEALSDLISELEVEGQNEQRMLIESKLHILEEQARQQYKASRYAVCLESIGEWSRTSEIGGVSRSKIENAFHVLQLRDEVTYLRQKQMHAEAKLQEAKSILQSDAEQARQMLVVAQAKFKEVNEGRPEILTQIADISHAIVTVFVEIIVQDNLVNAAISFSENERFRIAKLELQSSLYVAQGHLQKNDLYHCIEFADKALLTFSSQIAELSASCIDMSVSEQLAQVRDEAKDLLVKDDAAALAEEQLSFAQSIYNGANYDDARLQLSVARKIGERAGHRLKDHVRESLDAFARAVDTDEIGSVWKWVVTKVEEVNDAEISSEITALVNNAVANVAGVLSELCGDETIPTPDQLDALVNSLNATVDRAKARVSRLSRPSPNNGLWAAAVALSQECRHLSNCAQARHCLDDYLVSIQDYHNRITKKLPLQRLRIAKNWWQAASDSSLAVGPSGLYVMHENSGIRMEVLRTLLRRCEDETEKSIESAKQRIVECVEKQAAAVQQVLAGDFVAGEQLLLQVVALDMTLNRAFWKRNKQIEDVARTSRRCAELKALAEQQHETTLQLMKEEVTLIYFPPHVHTPTNFATRPCRAVASLITHGVLSVQKVLKIWLLYFVDAVLRHCS